MSEYKAYRYVGGNTKGKEICADSDREAVFNTAEMDANAILEALNRKAREGAKDAPSSSMAESCHMITDDKAQVIEIRQDSDGMLMYYYDVV